MEIELIQLLLALVGALAPIYALLFWIGLKLGKVSGKVEVLQRRGPLLREEK